MDLNVLGEIKPVDRNAVAVVGSRKMTSRGKRLTEFYVREIVRAGYSIVSGLARGIDTVAHETALSEGGRTIAVLGTGIDIIYPTENKDLAEKIAMQGALVSAFPNGTKPLGPNFLARNEIIVKLSSAVLVIEGLRRSGTISTANHAGNLNVEVFAIPGSEACDWLITQGANITNSPSDIIEYLKRL